MGESDDFITQYLNYIGETECPIFYHRWCCISIIGAFLGREYGVQLGHFDLYPNKYIMLIGTPGTRKSTAIKIAKKIITAAGYDNISADRSSKEKFLLDLSGDETENLDSILDKNLWGEGTDSTEYKEMFIACDEFNDFIGNGNVEFISLLGNLWDYNGPFKNRIKTGKSVCISNPTISILGGNTPVSFARAFPAEVIGQGFFSRLFLIHGEPTGKRITFPVAPGESSTAKLAKELQRIKLSCQGKATLTKGAEKLLDKIYQTYKGTDDIRFEYYNGRRFPHLLKLCLIISASFYSTEISERHVVIANTILTHTEHLMPKALGEFGKSRNSDVTHKLMTVLNTATCAMPMKDLWSIVQTDLEKVDDLSQILRNLLTAGKIMAIKDGFLSNKKVLEEVSNDVLDYSILTKEEREMSA